MWGNTVRLLDEGDGAGWSFLEQMIFARENVMGNLQAGQILTTEGVLSSPFLEKR